MLIFIYFIYIDRKVAGVNLNIIKVILLIQSKKEESCMKNRQDAKLLSTLLLRAKSLICFFREKKCSDCGITYSDFLDLLESESSKSQKQKTLTSWPSFNKFGLAVHALACLKEHDFEPDFIPQWSQPAFSKEEIQLVNFQWNKFFKWITTEYQNLWSEESHTNN